MTSNWRQVNFHCVDWWFSWDPTWWFSWDPTWWFSWNPTWRFSWNPTSRFLWNPTSTILVMSNLMILAKSKLRRCSCLLMLRMMQIYHCLHDIKAWLSRVGPDCYTSEVTLSAKPERDHSIPIPSTVVDSSSPCNTLTVHFASVLLWWLFDVELPSAIFPLKRYL